MCKFRKRKDKWGTFVDVKVNVPELLARELRRRPPGKVSISTVTDPYQPVERRYQITRQCLQLLLDYGRRISILTKSDLVLRDLDLLKQFKNCEVGLTITTDNERIKKLFEPASPTIRRRITALRKLKEAGIVTYAFIGPLLPANPEKLGEMIAPFADSVLVDRMNYRSKVVTIYRQNGLEAFLEDGYFENSAEVFKKIFEGKQVDVVY
jgi:DNA repair photolyase